MDASEKTFPLAWEDPSFAALQETLPVHATITPHMLLLADRGTSLPRASFAPDPRATIPTLPLLHVQWPDSAPAEDACEYQVTGTLGEGGVGRVFLARQRSLSRDVALKVLKDLAESSHEQMLLTEARLMGFLDHPNILPVHTLGRDDQGRPVIVMKRIGGVRWSDLVHDPEHRGWNLLQSTETDLLHKNLEILMVVAAAVHFAHGREVVHRDLKPENILIGEAGDIYVADWGIALHLPSELRSSRRYVVGTPAYMAPEMVLGNAGDIDGRTDVYLLGAILHEILTGHFRNTGSNVRHVLLAAIRNEPPEYGPDVPSPLAAIARKATSFFAKDRYPSALAFRQALAEYWRHRGAMALALAAEKRLVDLRLAAQKNPADRSPRDVRDLMRLMDECRFGFRQALGDWPDNPQALAGLRACLEMMVRYEIDRLDLQAASALLDELEHPPEELVAKLEHLRRTVEANTERARALDVLQRDFDASLSLKERRQLSAAVFGAVALSALFFTALIWLGRIKSDSILLLATPLVLLAVAFAALRIQRRTVRIVGVYRKALRSLILGLCILLCHRAEAIWLGMGLRDILLTDSYILAAFFGVCAVLIWPHMVRNALVHVVAAWAIAFSPRPFPVFIGSMVLTSALLLLAARSNPHKQ